MPTLSTISLCAAGVIGGVVSCVHGYLADKLMVRPVRRHLDADPRMSGPVKWLIPPLLHFSTFNWLIGGVALIVAATLPSREARVAVGVLVGSSYAYGTAINFLANRGRHPGAWLYGAAVALIVVGILA